MERTACEEDRLCLRRDGINEKNQERGDNNEIRESNTSKFLSPTESLKD